MFTVTTPAKLHKNIRGIEIKALSTFPAANKKNRKANKNGRSVRSIERRPKRIQYDQIKNSLIYQKGRGSRKRSQINDIKILIKSLNESQQTRGFPIRQIIKTKSPQSAALINFSEGRKKRRRLLRYVRYAINQGI